MMINETNWKKVKKTLVALADRDATDESSGRRVGDWFLGSSTFDRIFKSFKGRSSQA